MAETSENNQEPPTQNPETSQDSSITDTSEENPIKYFSLQIHPDRKTMLVNAIKALSEINNIGRGTIGVKATGMKIVFDWRFVDNAVCYLDLKGGHFISFEYNQDFNKVVSLKDILPILEASEDGGMINIQYVEDGLNELSFMFGEPPGKQEAVELLGTATSEYPSAIHRFEAVINSADLSEIIQHVEATESEPVVLEIANSTMSITVRGRRWIYDCLEVQMHYRCNAKKKPKSRLRRSAQFVLARTQFLRKALLLKQEVLLCFGTDPQECLILRFNLPQLGELVYVKYVDEPGMNERLQKGKKQKTRLISEVMKSGS